jgi:hypothetical protein
MFERNRIDNVPEPSAVPVEIAFTDGALVKGKLLLPPGKLIGDAINGSGTFIEFEPYGGERGFVAKAQIASLRPVGVPKAANLKQRLRTLDDFDPHQILGVAVDAVWEDVRQAYHRLSKIYHPDRYATAELPQEVQEYLSAMVRRVNAAYAALEAPRQVVKQAKGMQSTPVYSSQPRA